MSTSKMIMMISISVLAILPTHAGSNTGSIEISDEQTSSSVELDVASYFADNVNRRCCQNCLGSGKTMTLHSPKLPKLKPNERYTGADQCVYCTGTGIRWERKECIHEILVGEECLDCPNGKAIYVKPKRQIPVVSAKPSRVPSQAVLKPAQNPSNVFALMEDVIDMYQYECQDCVYIRGKGHLNAREIKYGDDVTQLRKDDRLVFQQEYKHRDPKVDRDVGDWYPLTDEVHNKYADLTIRVLEEDAYCKTCNGTGNPETKDVPAPKAINLTKQELQGIFEDMICGSIMAWEDKVNAINNINLDVLDSDKGLKLLEDGVAALVKKYNSTYSPNGKADTPQLFWKNMGRQDIDSKIQKEFPIGNGRRLIERLQREELRFAW